MKPIPLPLAELKNALTGLSKVIPRCTTLPILAAVKIERTNDGWIALTATDLDRYATVRLEQPTEGEAATVILPYEELLKTSKSCGKSDTLLIQSDGDPSDTSGIITYPVGGQLVEHRCQSFNVAEFPEFPRIKGDSIPLPDALRSSIHEAFLCASGDPTRYVVQGAYVDVSRDDGHYVVGTNGRVLYSSNSFKLPLKESVNIPPNKFIGWKVFNNDGGWQLKIGERQKKKDEKDEEPPPPNIQLTSRRWRFISKQIEGNYPNWRQVVPDTNSWNTRIELEVSKLGAVIQIIERMPCADQRNLSIGLQVEGAKLHLVGQTPGTFAAVKVPTEASIIGRPVTIFVNREFLTQALRFGLNTLHLIDEMSPLRLSHEGRQMIVMPVRANTDAPAPGTPTPAPEPHGPDEVENVNLDANQPAAEEAAQPQTTMKNNSTTAAETTNGGNGHQPAAEEKSSLELALEQIDATKVALRAAKDGLNTLTETLKQVQRDQKNSVKEVASVRSTLERLQSMKL